jgi:plastocyanin
MARVLLNGFVVGLVVALSACGESSSSTSPSPTPNPTPSTATVTIMTSGVSPKTVQVAVGGHITFTNNDTRNHTIDSDPHPAHTDCPAINQVGLLQPGESRDTASLTVARSCGYHDHSASQDTTMQGTIVVQ